MPPCSDFSQNLITLMLLGVDALDSWQEQAAAFLATECLLAVQVGSGGMNEHLHAWCAIRSLVCSQL